MHIRSQLKSALAFLTLVLELVLFSTLFSTVATAKPVRCDSLLPLGNAVKTAEAGRLNLGKNRKLALGKNGRNWLPNMNCRSWARVRSISLKCTDSDNGTSASYEIPAPLDFLAIGQKPHVATLSNDADMGLKQWSVERSNKPGQENFRSFDVKPFYRDVAGSVTANTHVNYYNMVGKPILPNPMVSGDWESVNGIYGRERPEDSSPHGSSSASKK